MPLAAGMRLGPYEVLGPIGAGGMGEVYKARDTRLDRTVAIKVLAAAISTDADRRARLEREARTTATLSHPHICTLYDVGEHDASLFLVMEYLAGQTLAERLRQGPLPIDQALEVGAQIAGALAAAHRSGIVHRDLKPANVMLTGTGVKLLDFGLAKVRREVVQAAAGSASLPPTASHPLTGQGTILGTLQYMAPEQLEGKEADARTDIWALGLVLYEMVTGARAFEGQTSASLIAAILERNPEPLALRQPLTPPLLERLILRCIAKAPDDRWQAAGDVAAEVRWLAESRDAAAAADRPVRRRAFWSGVSAGAAVCAIAGAIAFMFLVRGREAPRDPQRELAVTLDVPRDISLTGTIALSPDGRAMAFSATRADGASGIWIRDLGSRDARLLPATEGGTDPFWSPSGESLGFFTEHAIKRIELGGGPPSHVTDLADVPRGATWNAADEIVFGQGANKPLYRVSAKGGPATALTALDRDRGDTTHRFPTFLPDGKRVLFCLQRRTGPPCVAEVSLDQAQRIDCVLAGESTGGYRDGAVYYVRGHSFMRQPFDVERAVVSGPPVALFDRIWRDMGVGGRAGCSLSGAGVIACRDSAPGTRIAWVDANGRTMSLAGPEGSVNPVSSPNGQRLMVLVRNEDTARDALWVLEGDTLWALSPPEMNAELYAWRPDGGEVVFGSDAGGNFDLYLQAVQRGSSPRPFFQSPAFDNPTDWSRDGEWILFSHDTDILRISSRGGEPVPVIRSRAHEANGRFSPDRRWIAYQSDESGRVETYVLPFEGGDPVRVSHGGGTQPQWRDDGRELYFARPDGSLASVSVDTQQRAPITGAPRQVLPPATIVETGFSYSYAVGLNGRTFAVNTRPDASVSNRVSLLVGTGLSSARTTR